MVIGFIAIVYFIAKSVVHYDPKEKGHNEFINSNAVLLNLLEREYAVKIRYSHSIINSTNHLELMREANDYVMSFGIFVGTDNSRAIHFGMASRKNKPTISLMWNFEGNESQENVFKKIKSDVDSKISLNIF